MSESREPTSDEESTPPVSDGTARRRVMSRWNILVALGIIGVCAVVVVAIIIMRGVAAGYSPGYSGAPVEAADAEPGAVIVGFDNQVSYRIGPTWVNAADYVDVAALMQGVPASAAIVGNHYTDDPTGTADAFVGVVALPARVPGPPLDAALEAYLEAATSVTETDISQAPEPFVTEVGLEGFDAAFVGSAEGFSLDARAAVLGRGVNTVFVTWMSYHGDVDEAAFRELLESVRIDP